MPNKEPTASIVARIAKILMAECNYKTMMDSGAIYVYQRDSGVYVPEETDWKIRSSAQRYLGDIATKHMVDEIYEFIRRTTAVSRSAFDRDPDLLCVGNGILNTRTLDLIPHDPTYLFLRHISVDYDSVADCPEIKNFFRQVVDTNNVKRLVQLFGYLLINDYAFRRAFILVGATGAGKSTLLTLLGRFIGENNLSNLSLQQLCSEKFVLPRLAGKMANVYDDLSGSVVKDSGILKVITGNGPGIEVQNKHEKPFMLRNTAKLIFACNEIPAADGADDAYYDRWVIIPFPHHFRDSLEDSSGEKLIDRLTSSTELSGLLNIALQGRREIETQGFDYPLSIDNKRLLYRAWTGDTVYRFFSTQLIQDLEAVITKRRLYAEYCSYCNRSGKPAVSDTQFWLKFATLAGTDIVETYSAVDGMRQWMVKGLRVRGDSPDDIARDTIPYTISIRPTDFVDDDDEEEGVEAASW